LDPWEKPSLLASSPKKESESVDEAPPAPPGGYLTELRRGEGNTPGDRAVKPCDRRTGVFRVFMNPELWGELGEFEGEDRKEGGMGEYIVDDDCGCCCRREFCERVISGISSLADVVVEPEEEEEDDSDEVEEAEEEEPPKPLLIFILITLLLLLAAGDCDGTTWNTVEEGLEAVEEEAAVADEAAETETEFGTEVEVAPEAEADPKVEPGSNKEDDPFKEAAEPAESGEGSHVYQRRMIAGQPKRA
jgi:hypothetical protein